MRLPLVRYCPYLLKPILPKVYFVPAVFMVNSSGISLLKATPGGDGPAGSQHFAV